MRSEAVAEVIARRLDSSRAYSDEAEFFGRASERVFGVLHRPTGTTMGGVVICPSIYAEFTTGYGIDVALARSLASRGLAVQRFHYRGVGHSDGHEAEVTFTTMREDALAAAERLVERAGVSTLGFLGTRFGGLIAASAAAEYPASPLVLVEPIVEAERFFRDAWRAVLVRDVKERTSPRTPGQGLAQTLARDETVDILGYAICRALYDSAAARTLAGELGDGARRILLVQLGRLSAIRQDLEGAAATLRALGCSVDVELIAEDVTWWFPPGAEAKQPKRPMLVAATSGWLANEFTTAVV